MGASIQREKSEMSFTKMLSAFEICFQPMAPVRLVAKPADQQRVSSGLHSSSRLCE
jgi:hypothetical protein